MEQEYVVQDSAESEEERDGGFTHTQLMDNSSVIQSLSENGEKDWAEDIEPIEIIKEEPPKKLAPETGAKRKSFSKAKLDSLDLNALFK